MNTIRFDEIEDVKLISEFTIRDRVWFTYYNDISKDIKVVDKILGAALPGNINSEGQARAFLFTISDKQLSAVILNMEKYLNENDIKIPINKELSK